MARKVLCVERGGEGANALIDCVGSISDDSRYSKFGSVVICFGGAMEIVTAANVVGSILFSEAKYSACATPAILDHMFTEIRRRIRFSWY